ncbi:MAG: DUF6293 family protein, partial [Candidatus Hermodarchaeota archaeon]
MSRIVQICPVGFEYQRILEGLRIHPSNVVYLLRSFKNEIDEADPDKKLIEIANNYVQKLNKHLADTKTFINVIVTDTTIIDYKKSIEELCKIIREELYSFHADQIFINVSTSNKLFVGSAMYVGSFFP